MVPPAIIKLASEPWGSLDDYTQERAAGMARHSALTALARGDKKHNNNTQLCLLLTTIYLFKNEWGAAVWVYTGHAPASLFRLQHVEKVLKFIIVMKAFSLLIDVGDSQSLIKRLQNQTVGKTISVCTLLLSVLWALDGLRYT